MSKFEAIANYHCGTGENPLWDDRRQVLFWTDIPNGLLFRYDPATGAHSQIYSGEQVGGFTFQEDGSLLLFRVKDIAVFDPDTGRLDILLPFEDEGAARFNDVIADPAGRVYAGTIGRTPETGGLYRVDLDGTITRLFLGTRVSNGMAFTADHRSFYWTDSTAKLIYRFAYDKQTGELSNRELFYTATPEEGTPDGLTIDTGGHIWSARWDGFRLIHHAADSTVLESFEFPVAKVSSVCFGGENLDQFYITTAGGGRPESKPEDGTLYRMPAPCRGYKEYRSRILMS